MPLKKSIRPKKSTRMDKSSRLEKLARLTWGNGAAPIVVAVTCILVAAILIAANQPSQTAESASAEPAAQTGAMKAGVSSQPVAANGGVESETKALVKASAPVTITGCLERADATFRLKDTTGADAPKGRSWKSGFLKKSSASVDLVDPPNGLKLPAYVGQRVAVTGTLVDREMRVRSLKRVATSCGSGSRMKA
jgi:hypothetical protein